MSLKYERDTSFREAAKSAVDTARDAARGGETIPGTSGKHPIAAAIGTAVTGGTENAGTKGYLAVCLPIQTNPPAP